jgi:hypothetical protein
MRRSRGPIGLALASVVAALLWACDAGQRDESSRDRDQSKDASGGGAPAGLTWGPVERVAGSWGGRPATVMAPDGTATVMWLGPAGGISREAPPGEPWKPGQAIPYTGSAADVIAGVDRRGTVTAVWDDWRSARYSFWTAQHPAGGRWSRPVQLGGGPEGDLGYLDFDLAVGPSGAAMFAWVDEYERVHTRYRPGVGAWSPPTLLPGTPAPELIVTIDADGLATVGYLDGNTGLLSLGQRSGAGWQRPVKVGAKLGIRPYDIDAGGAGVVVAAWQESDYRYMTGRISDGKLTGRRPLTKSGERSTEMQVAASPDGSARFVWRPAGVGTHKELHGLDQSATGTLSDPVVIGPTSRCPAQEVFSLALGGNGRGDSILAWSGSDPSGLDVAVRSPGAEEWSKQDSVVPGGSGPDCYAQPTVGIAEDGTAMVTWPNHHSSNAGLEATELLTRRTTTSEETH